MRLMKRLTGDEKIALTVVAVVGIGFLALLCSWLLS